MGISTYLEPDIRHVAHLQALAFRAIEALNMSTARPILMSETAIWKQIVAEVKLALGTDELQMTIVQKYS